MTAIIATAEMRYVYSSHVAAIGYDEDARTFHVKFGPTLEHPGGRNAVYQGVSPETAENVINAPSIGSAIHAYLKGKHTFRYT